MHNTNSTSEFLRGKDGERAPNGRTMPSNPDELRAIVAANERELADTRAERAEELAAQREFDSGMRASAAAALSELAKDLGATSGQFAPLALALHARSEPHLAPIWAALNMLSRSTTGAGVVDAAIEARHALVGTAPFGPVRSGDSVFGGGAAKRLRMLPPPRTSDAELQLQAWYPNWLPTVGIVAPHIPDVQHEEPEQFRARIERQRARGLYDRKSIEQNDALARKERELLEASYRQAAAAARAEHARELSAVRAAVVAVVDGVLAKLDLGVKWWWCRELRRHLAGEKPRIPSSPNEVPLAWNMCGALGLALPFAQEGV